MLHYRTYKLGPDAEWVVFIHGAGGSSSIWFKQLREFRAHFNVMLVDLRGHGGSQDAALPNVKYTFDDLARDVLEVLDAEGIPHAHFVGISLGCILIRTIAELEPERIQTMVLGGAVTRLNRRSRVLVALGNLFKRVVPFLWLYRLFAWVIMPRKTHREARSLFISEAKKLCQKEFLRWFRLTWEVTPLLRLFEEKALPTPTLYLMGSEDHMFLPAVRALVRKHAASVLEVLHEAGHVCNVDRPDDFNARAIAFIHKHVGAQPVLAT